MGRQRSSNLHAILFGAALLVCRWSLSGDAALAAPAPVAGTFAWDRVNLGGGGHNHGIVVHPAVPDLVYARQDVSGLLRWDPAASRWRQLLDWMPVTWRNTKGCAGLAVDTSAGADRRRQDTVYAALGQWATDLQCTPAGNGVWRSIDRGDTWVKIWDGVSKRLPGSPFLQASFASNTGGHPWGECLAVDPVNPQVLYVGTQNDGLHRTFDATGDRPAFEKVAGVPNGFVESEYNPTGVRTVLIDPRGGVVDADTPRARSRVVFVSVPRPEEKFLKDVKESKPWAFGVYRTRDGGETWDYLNGPGAPGRVARMALGKQPGEVIVSGWEDVKGLRKFDGQAWSVLPGTEATAFKGLATDAADRDRVVAAATEGNGLWASRDGGRTWVKHPWNGFTDDWEKNPGLAFEKLNWVTPSFVHPGGAPDYAFDPHRPGGLWFGDAFGAHYTTDVWAERVRFSPRLTGYETTVTWSVCAPPSDRPALYQTCADVIGFAVEDPARLPAVQLNRVMFPSDSPNGDAALSDIEYAPSAPECHVALRSTLGGYYSPYARIYRSADAGRTWAGFDAPPPNVPDVPDWGRAGGPAKVAVSATDKNHWVYVGAFRTPYYTTNGFAGESIDWRPSTGIEFWARDINPYAVNLIRLAADAVEGMRFYLLHKEAGKALQLWVSEDGGATWAASPAQLPEADPHLLQAVKGAGGRGELWLDPKDHGLWRSVDGGRSFARVNPDVVRAAHGVAFGKAAPGADVPTLFVVGKLLLDGRDREGVFFSTDMGDTFTAMTDPARPFGGSDVMDMAGDWRQFGRVYVGTGGTGVLYSTHKASAP